MVNASRRWIGLAGLGLPLSGLLLYGAFTLTPGRSAPQPSVPAASRKPGAIPVDPGWYLQGGLLSGRFLGQAEQDQWPGWMQVLMGDRVAASPAELEQTDLYRVPDAFLVQAMGRLTTHRVFTARLLRQATAIGYTARAAEWQEAKSAYQVAYLQARGLPAQDPSTFSLLLTQLAYRNEFDLLRQSLAQANLPQALRESWLRLLDLREGRLAPTETWILDRRRPASERLPVLFALKRPPRPDRLLQAFKGTDQLDLAVFHAVSRAWIPLASPRVSEALRLRKQPDAGAFWFLSRPEERVSDLLWMRAMDALRKGARRTAIAHAKTILARYPDSLYAGHAGYLLAGLEPAHPRPSQPALRVPGDITLYNARAVRTRLGPVAGPWPEHVRTLAEGNRYDLILAQADPGRDEALFLRAAFQAGQQDLIARYQALEHRSTLATVPYLYPTKLESLVARLIQEEGLTGQVDSAFVLAMIKNESIFQPNARSGSEAFGIMQLLRPTFARMVGKEADILDPETNIRAGLRYYRTVIRTARLEDLPEEVRMLYILAGYHAGEGRARRWRLASERKLQGRTAPLETMLRIDAVPITSTRYYILRVLGDRQIYRQLLGKVVS